jgi:hypothetical protein
VIVGLRSLGLFGAFSCFYVMQIVIDTIAVKGGVIAKVSVRGFTSQDTSFKTKRRETEKEAMVDALHWLKHIYL